MDIVLYVLKTFTGIVLLVEYVALLVRALLSWFMDEETKIERFLVFITEPFIIPIRALLSKLNILQDSPLDFSYLFTAIIISLLLPLTL